MLTVRQSAFDAELDRFLIETPSGTPGGIRIRDAAPAIDEIPDAVWFVARDGDTLAGAYALWPRSWGWWRCHLTVTDAHAEQAIPALVRAAATYEPAAGAVVAGSCEDSHTTLRRCLAEVGYDEAAVVEVIVWSRRRAHPDVGPVQPHELTQVQQALDARGVGWSGDLDPASFLVLRRDGAICAGVSVRTVAWHLDSLGAGSGVTLPLLGLLGLKLDPLRLCAFQGSFGATADVDLLWRGALHHTGNAVALVGSDVRDPRWAAWAALRRGGVGRAIGTSVQRVFARGSVPAVLDWGTEFLR